MHSPADYLKPSETSLWEQWTRFRYRDTVSAKPSLLPIEMVLCICLAACLEDGSAGLDEADAVIQRMSEVFSRPEQMLWSAVGEVRDGDRLSATERSVARSLLEDRRLLLRVYRACLESGRGAGVQVCSLPDFLPES